MKNTPLKPVLRGRGNDAFTLIELLAVMAIILVLAGLILNIAGSANYNSAKARATSEVKAIENALESYKSDNGAYPPDPFAPTDTTQAPSGLLDPQVHFDPLNTKYIYNSEYLYQVLSGFQPKVTGMTLAQPTTSVMTKAYMTFVPQQLHIAPDAPTGTAVSPSSPMMYIVDPFGFSYGYSTFYAATAAYNTANSKNDPITVGYNPTFDLWSTAGYASGGKRTPSNLQGANNAAKYSSLWVKNWQ